MKLNPDCIRDILLFVEKHTDLNHHVTISRNKAESLIPGYSAEEIMYHAEQCKLSGFFQRATHDITGNISISYLSPEGHEFLENIKPVPVWEKIKSKTTASIPVIAQLAKDFALAYFQGNLQ